MINSYTDDLLSTSWLGEVVDIDDPQKIGRIKVKVWGKFDTVAVENIPWAYPANNQMGGSKSGGSFFSIPKLGSTVSIKFDMGNIYHPEYYFNQTISDEVKTEISDSYANAHVIIYDSITDGSVKLFFTEKKGLMIDYKGSHINILPDKSIELKSASGNSKIQITDDGELNITESSNVIINCKNLTIAHTDTLKLGENAIEPAILGDTFLTFFNSHTHIGNLGAPTAPPSVPMTKAQLSQKKVFLS